MGTIPGLDDGNRAAPLAHRIVFVQSQVEALLFSEELASGLPAPWK
jgi:hypothetical protein